MANKGLGWDSIYPKLDNPVGDDCVLGGGHSQSIQIILFPQDGLTDPKQMFLRGDSSGRTGRDCLVSVFFKQSLPTKATTLPFNLLKHSPNLTTGT